MTTYYNENDPYAAQWLRNLIQKGLIAYGEVDDRSILDVRADDLRGFTQCHFFAGIGGWSLALRLAGWDDARPVWTGSCPCQPFSIAGKCEGEKDERHLWPEFRRLIAECDPPTIFGEQVASPAGRDWLSGVRVDLERMAYAVGCADLCAAGIGAEVEITESDPANKVSQYRAVLGPPHIRQRLWWLADSGSERRQQERESSSSHETSTRRRPDGNNESASGGENSGLDDSDGRGRKAREPAAAITRHGCTAFADGSDSRMADSVEQGLERYAGHGDDGNEPGRVDAQTAGPVAKGRSNSGIQHAARNGRQQRRPESSGRCAISGRGEDWSDYVWIPCGDGKARRIKPGLKPLADGVPARVGKLRAYGNAIVPEVAAEFIRAFMAPAG